MNPDIRKKKKTLIEKKTKQKKEPNSALRHVRTDFWSMISEERLNYFMTDVPLIKKPVH